MVVNKLLNKTFGSSRAVKLCLAVIVSAVTFAGAASAIYAQTPSRNLGGRPAYPREDNPRSQSIFVHEAAPGALIADGVEVVNNTDSRREVVIYAADYVRSSDGAFACAQQVDEKKGVASWINLAQTQVTLEKASTKKVDFNIVVPEDAEPGEHNGCIVIQELNSQPVNGGGGIGITFRSAIRIAITVPGEIVKELRLKSFHTITEQLNEQGETKRYLEAVMENVGNVSLDTHVKVDLQDVFGNNQTLLDGTYAILRNNEQKINAAVPDNLFFGLYEADIEAVYDQNTGNALGINTNVQETTLSASSERFFVLPDWSIAVIIALTLLLIVFFYKKRAFLLGRLAK